MTDDTTMMVPAERGSVQLATPSPTPDFERNPALAYLMSLSSKRSRRTMATCLNLAAQILGYDGLHSYPWRELRRHHVQAVRERLSSMGRAPATINTYIAALKGVALEAWGMKQLDTDRYLHIKQIRPVRGSRLPRGRALEDPEITQIICTCENDKTVRGVRDAAILSILFGCGLRRSELVALNFEDVLWQEEAIRVLGKGNKQRLAFMPDGVVERLRTWIDEVRGDQPGALFTRIRRGDDVTSTRLTDQGIYYILDVRRQEAGVEKASPHDARRTYATKLFDNGEDIKTVMDAMGHANINTTQIYDRRGEARLKRASKRLSV